MKANSVFMFIATILLGAVMGILGALGFYIYKNDVFGSGVQKDKQQFCMDKANCVKPKIEQPKITQQEKNEIKQMHKTLTQDRKPSDFEMEYRQLKLKYDATADDLELCQVAIADVAATNNFLIDKLSQEVKESKAKMQEAETKIASVKHDLDVKIKKLKELESVIKQKEKEIKKLKQKRK